MRNIQRASTKRRARGGRERGAALLVALLCMTLLFALALALLLSTTTDTLISASYRASEEAFFAADAGIAVGRRAIARSMAEQITAVASNPAHAYRPDSQVLPDSASAPNSAFFRDVSARAADIANDESRSTLANESRYQIEVVALEGGPTTSPVRNPTNGLESYVYTYEIKSTGRSRFGARAEVIERGELQTQLTAAAKLNRVPFSIYGTFFDRGDPGNGLVLVSGTFTGPVHTNSHLAFSSHNTVIFRDRVTQGDGQIVYDGSSIPIPGDGMQGIVVGRGAFSQDKRVPLPKNNFVQELAVVNGSGYVGDGDSASVGGNGRVTPDALSAGLSDAQGRPAQKTANGVAPGVYVSSSEGTEITGGGIYVSGSAQIALSTSGDSQVINIVQGGTSSTVTINYAGAGTTTLTTGGVTRTFTGVPMDSSLGAAQAAPGISLFVDGSITSLSGPQAVDGQVAPAISPKTAMTITSQRDIVVTGDIKYADPVIGPDGSPLPRTNQNSSVLGIFTNDGNVVLQPDPARTDAAGNLEIDAAIAAFNSNTSNDAGKLEGTIVYGSGQPRGGAVLRIVGTRIQSNIANIKYRKRGIFFDPRLAGGQFAPPFFPGIEIRRDPQPLQIDFAGEQAVRVYADAWQRDERRRRKDD
jgi:Tfp pilus assembly protein PilX